MPLYEFYCQSCDTDMELIRKISEADDPTCPECEKEGLNRKTSKTAFQLKGGGWYKDGYSSKGGGSCPSGGGACPSSAGGG